MVEEIANGFDSEAAIVSLGRLAVNKILYEEQKNVRQWLDQCLCRWAQVYSNFIVNDPSSFCLP